ncbi:zinc-binding dehydrogenase [Deinococcus sp. QL22]|uniref:zinc-dependent alcohol dehydrogenase n=1 Tax=Deinococcus sp. QL22 TaxID=2939437 RepID=UPI002017757E|nr:alcohol dehydrogenase catalytic domain-containing protein [Deinococcus sp. QL22]UQN08885.1 alcohol dehydrogenase catalytic domain-containing protein [Deinococcus sp. QL22]
MTQEHPAVLPTLPLLPTMRTARLHAAHDLRLHDETRPLARPGEVLLKVEAVSVCGSDMHYYTEGGIGPAVIRTPMTPGHEFAATVIGGTGEPYGLSDGTLVAVDPAQHCGHCEQCLAGYPNLCPNVRFLGSPGVDGGLAEYISVPPHSLFAVPDTFSPALTALLEPLGVALHALDITRIKPMSGVTVLGAGPIGLMLLQVARICGAAHVRMVEPKAARREAARAMGADSVHEHHSEILELTGGRGEDYVLEATTSPDAPEQAAQIARIGGRITLVGIPDGDTFQMTAANARRKALIIKMSRRMGNVYPRAIELVRSGRVDIAGIATHHYPMEDAARAFSDAHDAKDGFLKAVIYPGGAVPGDDQDHT